MNIEKLATPHITLTRGVYGWTCQVYNGNAILAGYGFAPFDSPTAESAAIQSAITEALRQSCEA